MCDDDLADAEQIGALAEGIRDLLVKRAGLRMFLSEQGRGLINRGDHAHGTAILRMLERIGGASAPNLRTDPKLAMKAANDAAARFQKMRGGQ